MDPVSLSTSIAGFLSLAIQLSKILANYSNTVNSAPQEVSGLTIKVEALSHASHTHVHAVAVSQSFGRSQYFPLSCYIRFRPSSNLEYGGGHDKSTGGTRVGQLLVAMTGGRQG
jgi:hypothetical protein